MATNSSEDKVSLSSRSPEHIEADSNELTAAAALTKLLNNHNEKHDTVDDMSVASGHETDDEEEDEPEGSGDREFVIPQRFTKSGRKRAVPFPLKLMKVLSNKEYSHIISWMPSGKSFRIHKPKLFADEILPVHFKSAKISSFTRKLHRWKFVRHYRGDEAGAFYHENFQKDRIDLVEKMTCYKEPQKPATTGKANKSSLTSATAKICRSPMRPAPAKVPARAMEQQLPSPDIMGPALMQGNASLGPFNLPTTSLLNNAATVRAMQSTPNASDINAAIEQEVSRRLQERINAAAVSRQAMALMQLNQANTQGLPSMAFRQQPLPLSSNPFASASPLYQSNNAMNLNPVVLALLARELAAKEKATFKPQPQEAPFVRRQGRGSLPPTNIQGAKTA